MVLERSSLRDQCGKTFVHCLWQLIRDPSQIEKLNLSVLFVCLGNNAVPINPVTVFIKQDSEDPSCGHKVLGVDIPQKIKSLIDNPGFPLDVLRFSELLTVSAHFLG